MIWLMMRMMTKEINDTNLCDAEQINELGDEELRITIVESQVSVQ